jgi:predicted ester cyclase
VHPKLVVERYLADVAKGGRSSSLDDLVADETLKKRQASFRAAFPDLWTSTDLLFAEGSLVAAHLTGGGTHQGIFQGCPPSGRTWSATCTAIYRVESGRIVDSRVNWDLLSVLEQLGAVSRAATVSA